MKGNTIAIVIIVLIFGFLYFTDMGKNLLHSIIVIKPKQPYIPDPNQTNVKLWAGTYPPPGLTCPSSNVAKCIYTDMNLAQKDCSAAPQCVGYWERDGSWLGKAGTVLYQLVSDLKTVANNPIASFYKKNV